MVDLANVWTALRFEHPWTADRRLRALDSATITAIRTLSADPGRRRFTLAVAEMVEAIGDPATRILASPAIDRWPEPPPPGGVAVRELPEGVALISAHHFAAISDATALPHPELRLAAIQPVLARARGVILDLRTDRDEARHPDDVATLSDFLTEALRTVTTRTIVPPVHRRVEWNAFPSELFPGDESSGTSRQSFRTGRVPRISPRPGARDIPVVFIVNAASELPLAAAGLVRDGAAAIVSEGNVQDAPFVQFRDLSVGGVTIRLRLADAIDTEGLSPPGPTEIVERASTRGEDVALVRARVLLSAGRPFRPGPTVRLPVLLTPVAAYVPRDSVPSREARLFALVKFWGIIGRFYPSRMELPARWDDALPDLLPVFRDASTSVDYWAALGRLTNRLRDSHANLSSPQLSEWRGAATVPFIKTIVDGRLVVAQVVTDTLLKGARVRPGDIIRAIDGRDPIADGQRVAQTMSSSSLGRREYDVATSAGRGPIGSAAVLTLEGDAGRLRTERVPRYPPNIFLSDLASRLLPAVRLVTREIGYIDVGRVPEDSIDHAWEQVRNTRAVILDWRVGTGTSFPFVSRLMRRNLDWCRCRDSARQYLGEAVVLTDARAQSSMEVNLRALKEASGTLTIGAATSGTDGGVANVYVPGGIRLRFTTGAHFDRRGIQPDMPVRATIRGIRGGRDEVLEVAIEHLSRKLRS